MPTIEIIGNYLEAHTGFEYDVENTGGNCRALVAYVATERVIVVTEEAVCLYTAEGWTGEADDEPVVFLDNAGSAKLDDFAGAVRKAQAFRPHLSAGNYRVRRD